MKKIRFWFGILKSKRWLLAAIGGMECFGIWLEPLSRSLSDDVTAFVSELKLFSDSAENVNETEYHGRAEYSTNNVVQVRMKHNDGVRIAHSSSCWKWNW